MAGNLTRINNNQISTASAGNAYLGINASTKVQVYTITGGLLSNNLTYGSDLTVTGNLTVQGTTTAVNTVNTLIQDPLIVLADGQTTGTPTVDIGFVGLRGSQNSAVMAWKESASTFVAALSNTDVGGSSLSNTTFNINSYADFKANNIVANSTLLVNSTTSLIGNVLGNLNVTGNVAGGNLLSPGLISTTGNAIHGNILTAGLVSATANITGGNITTAGQVSATANITGGNVLTAGLISAAGNIIANPSSFFIGNGSQLTGVAASSASFPVSNGTSNINAAVNSNIAISVAGTSNVAVFASTGMYVTGVESVSGNITGGNILTAGLISATGTVTSAANVIGGNITTAGQVSATANITGGNVLTAGLISSTGNVTGGNLTTAGQVTATANITGGNILTAGLISATSTITSAANVTGGNITTGGQVSATANITGGNILTAGLVSATANVTGGNLTTAGQVTTPSLVGTTGITVSTGSGNITLNPAGNIVLNSKYINGLNQPVQDNDAASKIYVDNLVSTQINYHPAVYAATISNLATATGGTITYTQPNGVSNGIGAYLSTTGSFNLIDTANVQTLNTRILVKNEANGAYNGVYTWSNATTIVRSSDADEYGPNSAEQFSLNDYFFVIAGNVNAGSAYVVNAPAGTITFGTSNIQFAQFSSSQTYTSGNGISINGTLISAKTDGTTTAFDGTGNIIVKAGAQLTTPNIGAATGISLSVTGTVTASSTVGGVITGSSANVTGNVTGGNITTAGQVTATANITGGNLTTAGQVSATANITGGNILTAGLISATSTITSAANVIGGNLTTAGQVSATANITGGNITTAGQVSATANITGGNVLTAGLISATGTITSAANVIGGNLTTAGQMSATANITGGNVLTGGLISTTGNAIHGNILTAGLVSATANITGGNILTAGLISATSTITSAANITGGNLTTAGQVSATANITGGNILTAGLISSTGNITGGNVQGGNIVLTGNSINDAAAGGTITVNGTLANTNFAVSGLSGNVFFVNGSTNTVSFGSNAQTTNAIAAFNSTNSILIPVGNNTQKPSVGVTGMLRFNSTNNSVEIYNNSGWANVGQQTFTVVADETFTGNGVATIFNLVNSGQTTNGVIVSINGIVQAPTTAYAVSGAGGNILTFTEAPAVGDNIDVRELTTTTSVTSISGTGSNLSAGTNQIDITGNLIPTSNATQTLGNATNYWKSLYVSGNTIYLGGLQLQASGTTFSVYQSDGTTLANVGAAGLSVTSITDGTSAFQFSGVNGNAIMTAGGANTVIATSTGANVAGYLTASGNVTGSYIIGNGSLLTGLPAGYTNSNTATFLAAFGSNTISTTGTINAGNITGSNVLTGGLISSTGTITSTANITGGNLLTGGLISATGTITSAANVIGGNITTSGTTGILSVNSIIHTGTSGSGNIGASGAAFGNIFATAQTALYADLAEKYVADAEYAPGTVLVFGGTHEVTVDAVDSDSRVAGVVSTDPGFLMNEGLATEFTAAVALTGRVPCFVVGPVRKGDLMVSAGLGRARAEANPRVGTVIGKALENFDGAEGTIEVVVGRF